MGTIQHKTKIKLFCCPVTWKTIIFTSTFLCFERRTQHFEAGFVAGSGVLFLWLQQQHGCGWLNPVTAGQINALISPSGEVTVGKGKVNIETKLNREQLLHRFSLSTQCTSLNPFISFFCLTHLHTQVEKYSVISAHYMIPIYFLSLQVSTKLWQKLNTHLYRLYLFSSTYYFPRIHKSGQSASWVKQRLFICMFYRHPNMDV